MRLRKRHWLVLLTGVVVAAGVILFGKWREASNNGGQKFAARGNAKDSDAPFTDRAGYLDYIDKAEQNFRSEIADERRDPRP